MKLMHLPSLLNSPLQPVYPSLKSFTNSSYFFQSLKPIQTAAKSIENRKLIFISISTGKGKFALSSIYFLSKLLLKCCTSKSLKPGFQLHARITTMGLSKDSKLKNLLVNLYSKCQIFQYAQNLVDESSEPDMVSWSALISGYAQNGLGEEAILAFRKMHLLNVNINEFAFSSVLKASSIVKDLSVGKQIHRIALVTGFDSDVFVANTLVVMYAKCGEFIDSRKLFDEILERNVISWNALLSCYVQGNFCDEAVGLFHEMILCGIQPDEYSLSSILNAITCLDDSRRGKKIHGYLVKLGYEFDPFSANALVDMYAKVGNLDHSIAVFRKIAEPDIVSWNAVIAGCVFHECHDCALTLFREMKSSRTRPNMFTLSSVLKACAALDFSELGKQLHASLIKIDMVSDLYVCVGLIDLYSKGNLMRDARMLYDSMKEKDLIAFNALISGYSKNAEDIESLFLFADVYTGGIRINQTTISIILKSISSLQAVNVCVQVHSLSLKLGFQADSYVVNSLIDSYGKCSCIEEATRVFEECHLKDIVPFTSIITAYAQSGEGEEALKLYVKMQNMNIKPDSFVCSSLLNACANLSSFVQGKQVHVHILKFGFLSDVFAGNSLVNMYAKCGNVDDAGRSFSEITERGIVSWSAMIGGLAQHGHGKKALQFFNQMIKDGVLPNHVTLVSVLCACSHAGLVTEGREYFTEMETLYRIKPTQEHYACMIDLLGRAGMLDEALELIKTMPFEANGSVWGAVLGAARIHKNVELGQRAAEMLFILEPDKSGTHILLANIYASAGMWENVAKMRRLMKDSNLKKEPGMSWIEMKDKVYTFIVGDKSHPRSDEIYAKLDELSDLMNKAGYVPMVEIDLHDVEQRQKQLLLSHHSEKLAVAFGLIASPPGVPIIVKKNLRVCVDCHTAFKFMCKIVGREIVVRDVNRFHHFKDGSCSCGDYW